MRRLIYTILVIAIILAFTFTYFLLFFTYNKNIYSNKYSIVQSSSGHFILYLKLNTTKISPGQGIAIKVELFYTGTNPVYIDATYIHLPSPYPCPPQVLVGLEVFKGYYTTSNISLAKPLLFYKPGIIYMCPAMYAVTQYKLLPSSDKIQLIYNGKVQATLSDEISADLNGYWIINSTSSLSSGDNITLSPPGSYTVSGNYTFFQPGVYTVEAVDYFNQTVLGYFTVT